MISGKMACQNSGKFLKKMEKSTRKLYEQTNLFVIGKILKGK